jgi:deoxyadenosine/deoxycytidine kinase
MIIYIEGNIGTGKSTFVDLLNRYIDQLEANQKYKVILIQEPVDEWMKTFDSDGKNILEKFYEDLKRWAFTFQMNSFISRAHKIQVEAQRFEEDSDFEPLFIVERSIYTDRHCFAKNCFESGNMTKLEYEIYCRWNDWLSDQFGLRPQAYIYLRCPPTENVSRIAKRSREGECGIPLEYLQQLHKMHDEWMATEKVSTPVLTIDATRNFLDETEMSEIFSELVNFVHDIGND